jgi:hypothetical protein
MARLGFPKRLREFQLTFADEEACARYLAACRWPDGSRCPRCDHNRAYPLTAARLWQCAAPSCRYQTSVTSGTVLHRSKAPLTTWFWAAYLMTTDKRGVSALLLQHQFGVWRVTLSPSGLRVGRLGGDRPMTEWTLDAVHANGEFSIKHILFPASSEAPMPRSRHDPETSVSPRPG